MWHLIVSGAVCGAWLIVIRSGPRFRETTLGAAWRWSVVAASCWSIGWFVDCCCQLVSAAAADHVWYACAVLALCPPIAVLGSRRPGSRVWSQFIILPMILALFWPLLAVRLQGSELRGLHLEVPQLSAFILVLVMGVGNYCGTKYTLSALIYGAAVLANVISCSTSSAGMLGGRLEIREGSTLAMAVAVSLLTYATRPMGANRFNRVWFDFFDTFGIVWGRRIQDRVNFVAKEQGWPVRLELDGFVETEPSAGTTSPSLPKSSLLTNLPDPSLDHERSDLVNARIEHTLRWLLRRFVEPTWIDARLESEGRVNSIEVSRLRIDS